MTATGIDSPTATWTIDPSHSLVEFSARHMMITTVKGRLAAFEGAITTDERNPASSSVAVRFDAASIDTRAEQRDTHLRSGDFLDVENHPAIEFRSTRVGASSLEPGSEFDLVGELTIRGVTRPVSLKVSVEGTGKDPWGGDRISFNATTKFDRRDFDLNWNAALEAGGVLVSNEIKVAIEVQAVRSEK